jgi:hypothetical protein
MKHFLYLIAFALTLTAMSCEKKDTCLGIDCQNSGACKDGACECVGGYEGANCEIDLRARFVGTYTGVLTRSGIDTPNQTYEISKDRTRNGLVVSPSFKADYSGNNFTIPSQIYMATRTFGSGAVNGKTLTFTYTFKYNDSTMVVSSFVGTKP